jgi:hypothetical protein
MNTAQRKQSRVKRSYTSDPSAIYRLMNRFQAFTPVELVTLQTPVRVAFESLRTGRGEEADFHTLAAVVNVALIRSESIDQLCVETCQRAQDALMAVLSRSKRLGKWGLDAAGLQDIPPAMDLHEQLLELSTPHQMQQAMQETLRRMRTGHGLEVAV